jgi:hypothetical protein
MPKKDARGWKRQQLAGCQWNTENVYDGKLHRLGKQLLERTGKSAA